MHKTKSDDTVIYTCNRLNEKKKKKNQSNWANWESISTSSISFSLPKMNNHLIEWVQTSEIIGTCTAQSPLNLWVL